MAKRDITPREREGRGEGGGRGGAVLLGCSSSGLSLRGLKRTIRLAFCLCRGSTKALFNPASRNSLWFNPAIPRHSECLSPSFGYTRVLPTTVLFFFSHVTIPKTAITASCRNKDERTSVSYSAKELTKEQVTINHLWAQN